MIFKQFGKKENPTMILLHSDGLSWWQWKFQIDALEKDFNVIVPIIDGHDEDFKNTFESIEDSSLKVIEYIDNNLNGKVFSLYSIGIGAQIATKILSYRENIAEFAIIESASVIPYTSKSLSLINKIGYPMCKNIFFAKIYARKIHLPSSLFDLFFNNCNKITKKTIDNIRMSTSNYKLPDSLANSNAVTLIMHGKKENKNIKNSAYLLKKTLKNSSIMVLEDMNYCKVNFTNPPKHLFLVKNFIQLEQYKNPEKHKKYISISL